MKSISKALVSTIVAGAVVMGSAVPAFAQDRGRDRSRGDGISAGEVIAGAVILGGIAAVIASSSNNNRDYRDRNYRDQDYRDRDYRDQDYRDRDRDNRDRDHHGDGGGYNGGGYNARVAVDECIRAAERQAQRYSGANAEVYEVGNIDRSRRGFEVSGRIAVRNDYRGRGWGSDYSRGNRNSGWDEGRFSCEWRDGRVSDVRFSGIRNL